MQWAEYKRIFGGGNGWISGGSVYGSGLCYEDAEELQLGAGQLVFRGLELMFTVVFFLLVVWFQFESVMKCGGVGCWTAGVVVVATVEVYSVFNMVPRQWVMGL